MHRDKNMHTICSTSTIQIHTISTQYAHNNMQHIHLSTEQNNTTISGHTPDTEQNKRNNNMQHTERTQNAHTQDNNKDICSTQKITENKTTQHKTQTILHNLNIGALHTICTNIVLIYTMNI